MQWFKTTTRTWGQIVAGAWFIAFGFFHLAVAFEGSGTVLAVGAIAAGILLVAGK
jgi:hypothetical protein